jgi:hypothetical protein
MKRKTRSDGIRTVIDLQKRCMVDEDTDCWIWLGATAGTGARGARPQGQAWFPALRRTVTLGTIIGYLSTGNAPAKGQRWVCMCETHDCANPRHRERGTHSQAMTGLKRSRAATLKMQATKRAQSTLSEQDVLQIRLSTEPLRELAERHGKSVSYLGRVRSGECRATMGGGLWCTLAMGAK